VRACKRARNIVDSNSLHVLLRATSKSKTFPQDCLYTRTRTLTGFLVLVGFCLWSPYVIGQTIIFLPCDFYLSIFFFSSPNLRGRRLDVYHTLTHGVALVRIENAGLKGAARGSLKMQDPKKSPKIAIWAPSHKFVGLYLLN